MYAIESLSYKHNVYTSWFICLFIYILHIRIYACVSRFLARPYITLRISFRRITFMFIIPHFRLTFVCFDEATLWRTLRWYMGGGNLPCLQDWLEHSTCFLGRKFGDWIRSQLANQNCEARGGDRIREFENCWKIIWIYCQKTLHSNLLLICNSV